MISKALILVVVFPRLLVIQLLRGLLLTLLASPTVWSDLRGLRNKFDHWHLVSLPSQLGEHQNDRPREEHTQPEQQIF